MLINLTPHLVRIHCQDGKILELPAPPEGTPIPRVDMDPVPVGVTSQDGKDIMIYEAGEPRITHLPEPVLGRRLLVSAVLRLACPDRRDLYSPGELIRGPDGHPMGCKGIFCNWQDLP